MSKVGEMLRDERERQNLTFDDIEQSTSIRTRYLQAIEAGEYSVLPGDVYTKGFIRNYANILGLDGAEFVNMYNREAQGKPLIVSPTKSDDIDNPSFNNDDLNDTNTTVDKAVQQESSEIPAKATYSVNPPKIPTNLNNTETKKTADDFQLTTNHVAAIIVVVLMTISVCVYFGFTSVSPNISSTPNTIDKDKEDLKTDGSSKTPQIKKKTFELIKEGDKILVVPTGNSRINEIFLEIIFKKDTRGRVVADGKELYNGVFYKGQEIMWQGYESIMISIDDSSAFDMKINEQNVEFNSEEGKPIERTVVLQKKKSNAVSQVRLINEGGTITIVPLANAKVENILVEAEFVKDCWTFVVADGKEIFSGMIKKGEKVSWKAKESLKVNFGDAGAVKLNINGKTADKLGSSGEVVEKTIVIQGKKTEKKEEKIDEKKDEETKTTDTPKEEKNVPYTVNYKSVPSRLVERGNNIIVTPKGGQQISGLSAGVTIRDECWTQVTADGREIFSGMLGQGDVMSWQANEKLVLNFGNAGAVELTVNGNRVYGLGRKNESVEKNIIVQN